MGVTLDLRMIDHRHVVELGSQAVNNAIAANDRSILVEYIRSIPFSPDAQVIAYRQSRCDKLRELKAPSVIIESELRLLRLVNGEAFSHQALLSQSLDELRVTLGTWGWAQNSFGLGTAWMELDWFLQPAEGPEEFLLYPNRPKVGQSGQTLFDKAMMGAQRSPVDSTGRPIIATTGSNEEECFGYNPPDSIAAIVKAISAVFPDTWSKLVQARIDLHRSADPESEDIEEVVEQELGYARSGFAVLKKAYNEALNRGWGIACEYSV